MEDGKQCKKSEMTFQLDTGAECNLLSMNEYRRATGDHQLTGVQHHNNKYIKTYTDERCKIMGSTTIPTWQHGHLNQLEFDITEDNLAPLLSYKSCTELGFITINDSDSNPGRPVSVHDTTSEADLFAEFDNVFEGLGELPSEYHIVTDDNVPPVVHPPHRVPMALRDQIKEKLDEIERNGIITTVA